jgi:hypothetical protein
MGSGAPQQPDQTGAGQPGSIPPGAPATGSTPTPNTAANGVIPTASPTAPETSLDQFVDLWKTDPVDPNTPPKQNNIFGNVDPKKFMEAAGKIDFAKVVTPDQMSAISAGGDAAQKAFVQAMNSVAQSVYAQSSFATTKIVDAALARSKETFMADLPQHIKQQQVRGSLSAENPIFSNPAVQPLISAMEAQFTVKYPNASAAEITQQAKAYIEALGATFSPKPTDPNAGKKGSKEYDWSKFLE